MVRPATVQQCFTVGCFCFSVTRPADLPVPDNFLLFETPSGEPSYFYTLAYTEHIPTSLSAPVYTAPGLVVTAENGLESRLLGIPGSAAPYALAVETDSSHTTIAIFRPWQDWFRVDTVFCSLFSLEKHALAHASLVLHSAYITHNGQAVLFSAPSETGKSTQAGLWEQYRGAETINGDRSLLRCENGCWAASGWPVCGSSGICKLRSYPIRAIVMLSQAPENTVRRLRPMEAFRLLYGQITVNVWQPEAVNAASSLLQQLVTELPVYALACNISEDAVRCLEAVLP